ncbi:hypothetical protein D3C71_720060 [compost metagenome]
MATMFSIIPERQSDIRVEADEGTGFLGKKYGFQVGIFDGSLYQINGTEMQNILLTKPCFNLILIQQHICTGTPVKGEVPVAVCLQANKSQRRIGLIRLKYTAGIYSCILHGLYEEIPEGISTKLTDEGTVPTKAGHGTCDIGGCPSCCFPEALYLL